MAIMAEDFDAARALLAPGSVALSDGGAKQRAARRPLTGRDEILQVFGALLQKSRQEQGWTTRMAMVNTRPAFLRFRFGQLDSVTTLAPDRNGQIAWIYIMRNPDKLVPV
jgi:RNA polymerase sigma-70 factor (ECF subfamily)